MHNEQQPDKNTSPISNIEDIVPDPEKMNNMDLTNDITPTKVQEKEKQKENNEAPSVIDSDDEKYIHSSQKEEWYLQVDTVKFSAGVPLSVLKGTIRNTKIQSTIDKLNSESIT